MFLSWNLFIQEKFRAAHAELEELKYQQSERDRTYQHEVEQLSVKLKGSEAEKSNRGRAIEKLESEMMTMKSLLNDRDSSYKQAEVTISILQQARHPYFSLDSSNYLA